MTEQEFIIEQQKAIERMKRMAGNKAEKTGNIPSIPDFVDIKTKKKDKNNSFSLGVNGISFDFLDRLKSDKDSGLILGLILVLFCEKSDKLLLLALLYILL